MSTLKIDSQNSRDDDEIRNLFKALSKALHDKDARSALTCYARNAVIFDLSPPLYSGIGTDLEKFQEWMDGWIGPIEQVAEGFEISVDGDLAFGCGLYRLSGAPQPATEKQTLWVRATVCLRRERGGWRIVHEHTSVPFYMDGSYKAAIDLKPR